MTHVSAHPRTFGVFGGGQLGMFSVLAARELGLRTAVYDVNPRCAAARLCDELIVGDFNDIDRAVQFAKGCDAVSIDRDDIPSAVLEACAQHTAVSPAPAALQIVQDRLAQRSWLAQHGFPAAPFRAVHDRAEAKAAFEALGPKVILKRPRGGFDGRGQARVQSLEQALQAVDELGVPLIMERQVTLDRELSVLVASRKSGQRVVYPAALNHHEEGVLAWSVMPAPVAPELLRRAERLALEVAEGLHTTGLVAVELFVCEDELLVNEVALRPHNSFHATQRGTHTSQFEQHVRAVCDLPLGSTAVLAPTAIANVLGRAWPAGLPDLQGVLSTQGVRMHWYGKSPPKVGRKLGHLSASCASAELAVQRVLEALAALDASSHAHPSLNDSDLGKPNHGA
jgi:5-(carboxyamino)imidazole ribonucleotide synthase